jgi:hypothetical protein
MALFGHDAAKINKFPNFAASILKTCDSCIQICFGACWPWRFR